MALELTPDLLTGNEQIDREHGHLLALIVELERAEQNNEPDSVKNLFKEFLDYVTDHFVHEEFLMYQINYPKEAAKAHKNSHRLLQEVYLVSVQPAMRGEIPIYRLVELFQHEFMSHLLHQDKLLAKYLQDINYTS